MKKLLTLALAATLLLAALTSCRMQTHDYFKEELEKNPDLELPESEVMKPDPDDIPQYEINDTIEGYEEEETFEVPDASGELVVKYKIYNFAAEDRNVAVISVENHSDQALRISFDGICTDTQTDQSKTVTRSFEGFSAGWQNYFIFDPEMAFDDFTYDIEIEPYEGTTYGQLYQNMHWSGVRLNNAAQDPWTPGCVRVFGLFYYDYAGSDFSNGFSGGFVIFNDKDEVMFCEPDATVFTKVQAADPDSWDGHLIVMPHLGKDEGFMWDDVEPKRNNLKAEESNYVPTESMFEVSYGIFAFNGLYANRDEAPPLPPHPPISDIW